jgi:beta-galactosidase
VKVDHTDFADSRWYTGSGINRKVYLIPVQPVHVNVWGIQFTTPEVSKEHATAHVNVDIKNGSSKDQKAQVVIELLSAKDKSVAKTSTEVELVSGKSSPATLTFQISDPDLWSPNDPNLYKLKTTLLLNGKVSDVITEQVGFRFFTFDKDKGFSLNGVSMKMNGVCIHDDAGALGSAVPAGVWERRLRILKSAGCNAIRMSHNPHQDYLYDLCDKIGLLVQDEAFDEWEIGKNKWIKGWNVGTPGKDGYNKDFKEWAEHDLADMILRNRNRACIIMWSIGNEIDYPNDPYTHEILNTGRNPQIYGRGFQQGNPPASQLGVIARQLVDIAKKADSTRPITAALAGVVMSNETPYPDLLDVVGYNYQEYRYTDDHEKYPDRIIYGSENGHAVEAWKAVEENDYIAGQFLWTGVDFLGEARTWPVRSSGAGLLDLAGFPKSQYYIRKLLWNKEPGIFMATAKTGNRRENFQMEPTWNWNEGDSVNVRCFTNAREAELFVNGKSMGRKVMDGKLITWPLMFQPGELLVKGYNDEQEVAQQKIVTTGEANKLEVMSDHQHISVHRDSVVHLEIKVVDKNGRVVQNADHDVELMITGPGKLMGMESGDLSSHEDYKSNKRRVYKGKLLAYLQAEQKGNITIEIKANGLVPVSTQVKAQ